MIDPERHDKIALNEYRKLPTGLADFNKVRFLKWMGGKFIQKSLGPASQLEAST